ncbi:hypothetical protein ALP72_02278 [Pseudomonas coronafaciens pv. coronafaciens]|uniref:hypothetical protein n=1 Tax=Pseudomonas coronafaciens TaxID=53409 RepID=UPI000EFE1539|nr:hypothetical protein [Pseudomonas coronafaciens]RMS11926.1 hypothetical protein ALP72_02278 [Pseudomonas coronafaciens pv. coronafaciens]
MNEHEIKDNDDVLPKLNFNFMEKQADFPKIDFYSELNTEEKRKVQASSQKVIDTLSSAISSVEGKANAFSLNPFKSGFSDQLKRVQGIEAGLTKNEVGQSMIEPIGEYEKSSQAYSVQEPIHQPEVDEEFFTAGIGSDDESEEEKLEAIEVDLSVDEDGTDDEPKSLHAPAVHLLNEAEPVEEWEEIEADELTENVPHVPETEDFSVPEQDEDLPVYESVLPPADVEVPEHVKALSDDVAPFLVPSPVVAEEETQEPGGSTFDASVFAPVRAQKPVPTVLDRQIRISEKANQARLSVTAKPEFMSEHANARRLSLSEKSYQAHIDSLYIMKELASMTDLLKEFLENNNLEGAAYIIKQLQKAESLQRQSKALLRVKDSLVMGSYKRAFKDWN